MKKTRAMFVIPILFLFGSFCEAGERNLTIFSTCSDSTKDGGDLIVGGIAFAPASVAFCQADCGTDLLFPVQVQVAQLKIGTVTWGFTAP